ncbi:MAG: amino acid permease [Candidatus Eisenbacteria bacterium]|uniref:Amino acid permease n=1 Tax=Eiseniibacteriota bacterium TaxID=2212470 RepID=A0A849SIS7_UNCEI|nr:amino acid permease [Candidatus Eisenbacteria bacterium]
MPEAARVPPRDSVELKRQIGLYAATAITVGNIIGSGIFRSPNSVAQDLHGVGIVILAWVVGGILSICGSLVLAELAVTHPRTGGLYVFIREAFGDAWGFVFGWANLWVIKPTVIASITSVFALYFCQALGLPDSTQFVVGAAAIVLLTFVNWLGAREGAGTASVLTTLKVIGILGVCAAAFLLPATAPGTPMPVVEAVAAKPLLTAFFAAMIGILFAYDGWTDSTYVAGEIKNPKRVMPIAIVWGTWLVVGIYVLTNLAYYTVLGDDGVRAYQAVGSETVRRVLGEWGAKALAVLVAISTFGTTNGAILTGPRVTQAMAADGLLWKPMAGLDPRRGTPSLALWVQAVLSIVWLRVAGGFDDVSGWFVTTSWLFYGVSTAALFVYRRREKEEKLEAPSYRAALFPLTAIVFMAVTAVIIYSDFTTSTPLEIEGVSGPLVGMIALIPRAGLGVLIALIGFPVYWLWKGRKRMA